MMIWNAISSFFLIKQTISKQEKWKTADQHHSNKLAANQYVSRSTYQPFSQSTNQPNNHGTKSCSCTKYLPWRTLLCSRRSFWHFIISLEWILANIASYIDDEDDNDFHENESKPGWLCLQCRPVWVPPLLTLQSCQQNWLKFSTTTLNEFKTKLVDWWQSW